MSIFRKHHHEKASGAAPDMPSESVPAAAAAASAGASAGTAAAVGASGEELAAAEPVPFVVPPWLRQFGTASWLIIGLVIVLLAVGVVVSSLLLLLVPTLFAALLGATFLPLADALERKGLRRGLAGLLVMLLIVLIVVVVVGIVVIGVFRQFPTVQKNLNAATTEVSNWLKSHDVNISSSQIKSAVQKAGPAVVKGVLGTVAKSVQAIATLVFGVFIGLNILVWFLIQGRFIGHWAARHMSPVPEPVAYRIIANAARFLRGYIWGSTIIGIFNGGVMFIGALVLGVPLAATIGIVGWATNYVPTFGAIVGGAFAVLIALGSGGLTKGLEMLVVVIIANGSLQTVVSQFALGAALKLHPLAVLFATTAGAILFGALGGVVAAPFLKIAIDSYGRLKAIGLFAPPPEGGGSNAVATSGAAVSAGGAPAGDSGPPGAAPAPRGSS